MNRELLIVIEQIGREKGIDKETLFEALESALLSASRKTLGAAENVRMEIDRHTGALKVFGRKKVVEEVTDNKLEISLADAKALNPEAELEDELEEGIVVVKAAAREAGERAKVAVASTKRDVDPIGACVGLRGTRIQVISRELRGEKIDIIEWSHDPATFVARALSPAKVSSVTIGEPGAEAPPAALVIVPDNQLSLAIGKKGQNARLAAKLTGMRIDIKSESEVESERAEAEEAKTALMAFTGGNSEIVAALEAAGFGSPRLIAAAGREALAALPDVGDRADKIHAVAEEWLAARAEPAPAPEAPAEATREAESDAPEAPPADATPPTAGT